MKKIFIALVMICLLGISINQVAMAQSTGTLELGLSRDNGYGGFNNDIQGWFSMRIKNPPENLSKVEFYIDDTKIGEDSTSPFSLQFKTDTYPLGNHTLYAIGVTSDGQQIKSNTFQREFVPAKAVVSFIAPLFGLIGLAIIISIAVPLLLGRGKHSSLPMGTERKYGIGGGTICPNCNHPFSLRLWWINLGFNKIDRCPYCGRFGFFRPRSLAELRVAEQAELSSAQSDQSIVGASESDKLRKEIDESKYQDV